MKTIKTAEEVAKEVFAAYGFECDSYGEDSIEVKAMRIYAEQFINAAAEEILVDDSEDTNRKIILKLKEQLK